MFRPVGVAARRRIDEKYEVSSDGLVWSGGLPLEPIGGVGVNLHGKRMKIAYLVARAFIANSEGRPYVRHKNGDVTDNRVENLEWSELEEKRKRGRKASVEWCAAYSLDGEQVGLWQGPAEAARERGIDVRGVRRALGGKQKTAGGLLWRWVGR